MFSNFFCKVSKNIKVLKLIDKSGGQKKKKKHCCRFALCFCSRWHQHTATLTNSKYQNACRSSQKNERKSLTFFLKICWCYDWKKVFFRTELALFHTLRKSKWSRGRAFSHDQTSALFSPVLYKKGPKRKSLHADRIINLLNIKVC